MLTDDGRTDVVSSFAGDSEGQSVSQLDMIKEEIRKANSVNYSSAEKLWLDALDEEIHLSDIRRCAVKSEKTSACIGMIDDPEERKQYPLSFTFPDTGNVAVVGMPSSGKTTAVKTIMESLIHDNDPDKILIYGLDLDTGNLADYAGYNQVKRIVTQHDTLEIESFLDELQDLEAERKNESGDMRDILIFIDSYEDFRNTAGYRCENRLTELLREAPGTRMYFIITGGGFGLGQISGSAERNIKTVLSLSQRNKYEYMDALRTSEIKLMPENLKGRGLTVSEGRVLEFQIAVPR